MNEDPVCEVILVVLNAEVVYRERAIDPFYGPNSHAFSRNGGEFISSAKASCRDPFAGYIKAMEICDSEPAVNQKIALSPSSDNP